MFVHFIWWVYGFSVHSSPTHWLIRWWKVDSISPIVVTPVKDLSLLAGDGQIILIDKLQLSPLTKSFELAKICKIQYFVCKY